MNFFVGLYTKTNFYRNIYFHKFYSGETCKFDCHYALERYYVDTRYFHKIYNITVYKNHQIYILSICFTVENKNLFYFISFIPKVSRRSLCNI